MAELCFLCAQLTNIEVVLVVLNRTMSLRMGVEISGMHLTAVWECVIWPRIIALYYMCTLSFGGLSFGGLPTCTLHTSI